MDKLEHTISELERWIYFMGDEALNVFVDALELLKEQQAIIDQYHQADTFLATHGWQWKTTTTDTGTSPKDGDGE